MSASVVLPPERDGIPAPPALLELREYPAALLRSGAFDVDPAPLEEMTGSVRVLRYRPAGPVVGTIVHMHGGGFRLGIAEMSAQLATAVAARTGFELVCPDYRLAPEHPFPAGLGDGWRVLQAVQQSATRPVVVSGDSAGGALATGMALLAVAAGQAPDGLVLLSPWLDLTVTAAAFDRFAVSDPIFSRIAAEAGAAGYLQGVDSRDPLASPLFAELAGLPPVFLSVGSEEVLVDDAAALRGKLLAAGVATTYLAVPGMQHTAVARDLALPGSAETLDALCAFLAALAPATG